MPFADYQRAIIYKLARLDGFGEFYIGSTTNIVQRRALHKHCCSNPKYTQYKYQYIRSNGGWNDWCAVPFEIYPCESKTELEIRERYWIETLKPALNVYKPASITLAGGRAAYGAVYGVRRYIENRETMLAYQAKYYQENRESELARRAQYYIDNREVVLAQRSERITCECGTEVGRGYAARHRRSLKHLRLMEARSNDPENITTDDQ